MKLCIDVGNSQIYAGLFDGDQLVSRFRKITQRGASSDELGVFFRQAVRENGNDPAAIDAVGFCSVVPDLNHSMVNACRRYFNVEPFVLRAGVKTGLKIRYKNPAEVGADRIVNALAARELYGAPVLVVDFGTATPFDIVNRAGDYAGGVIAPGLVISAEALFSHASRLYQVDVKRPDRLIGNNTGTAMQSGLFFGYVGLVDGILERLLKEIPDLKNIVATGGQADLIAGGSKYIEEVNQSLTLLGLKLIHELNR